VGHCACSLFTDFDCFKEPCWRVCHCHAAKFSVHFGFVFVPECAWTHQVDAQRAPRNNFWSGLRWKQTAFLVSLLVCSATCQRASCATCGRDPCTLRHERPSADEARSRTMQPHWDDLKRLAQQELALSTFRTVRGPIGLVFVASHLACCSTMTSLDLWSDRS